jgi:hypothetical protein
MRVTSFPEHRRFALRDEGALRAPSPQGEASCCIKQNAGFILRSRLKGGVSKDEAGRPRDAGQLA